MDRAVQNLNVMNWQCDNKQWLSLLDDNSLEIALQKLDEARNTKQSYLAQGKRWICYPKSLVQNQKKRDFYRNIGRQIFDDLKSKGVNENIAYVIISQIVLETSWGTRIFGNNFFNIKGNYNGESVSFVTHEQLQNGRWVQVTDSFRKYPTIEDSSMII